MYCLRSLLCIRDWSWKKSAVWRQVQGEISAIDVAAKRAIFGYNISFEIDSQAVVEALTSDTMSAVRQQHKIKVC